MLDIKNKASLAINKFIDDAISASPDLKDKLDNISPISFDISVADIGPFYIKINKVRTNSHNSKLPSWLPQVPEIL